MPTDDNKMNEKTSSIELLPEELPKEINEEKVSPNIGLSFGIPTDINNAIFGFNGRAVRLNIGEKWVRVEGADRAMLVPKLTYSYAFALDQIASIEQVSLKPNGMVSLSITLLVLGLIIITSIDATLVQVVFKEYSIPTMIRTIAGVALLGFSVLSALYYLLTTTSVVVIQLNSGETITFYATPKNARNLWQNLRDRLTI